MIELVVMVNGLEKVESSQVKVVSLLVMEEVMIVLLGIYVV